MPASVASSVAALRSAFERKAHLAAQERLARALVTAGLPAAELADVSVKAAASAAPEATEGVMRRRERLACLPRRARHP